MTTWLPSKVYPHRPPNAHSENGTYSNPNVVTAQDQAFGVMKLSLHPHSYRWDYQPALAGPGFGPTAMNYSDPFTNGIPLPHPYSVNLASAARILAAAHRARLAGVQVVIVNLHWGSEYVAQPSGYQLRLARRLTRSPDISPPTCDERQPGTNGGRRMSGHCGTSGPMTPFLLREECRQRCRPQGLSGRAPGCGETPDRRAGFRRSESQMMKSFSLTALPGRRAGLAAAVVALGAIVAAAGGAVNAAAGTGSGRAAGAAVAGAGSYRATAATASGLVAPGWRSGRPAWPAWPAGLWRPGLAGHPDARAVAQPASGPAASGGWRIRHPANQAAPNGFLAGTSCSSETACMAVGSYENRLGTEVALAEAGHGGTWRVRAVPGPAGARWARFFGVSCTSANACTAVGWYRNNALDVRPLAKRWNGRHWRIQAVPRPSGGAETGLFAVSCASARACTAVGAATSSTGRTTALAEAWNGSRWRIQRTPGPAGSLGGELLAVSCSSAKACTAAGSYGASSGQGRTLAERWNGARWRLQAMPSPAGSPGSGIAGISCAALKSCVAAGSYSTKGGASRMLAERWNGSRWRIQARPGPAGATGSAFLGVSCSSPGACTAAGSYVTKTGPARTLAERWNGRDWRVQASVAPAGGAGAGLAGVSCPSARACTAVGSYATRAGLDQTLAGHWNGTSWRRQASPSPLGAAAFNQLAAVSCTSAHACTVVGSSSGRGGNDRALAEGWNGARWRLQGARNPAGATSSQLVSVSCTSTRACIAVGRRYNHRDMTLAERWDGTRWRVQATPDPAASHQSDLSAVSCTSARACTAVGSYEDTAGHQQPLAYRWNGTRWTSQAVPSAGSSSQLFAVSCASAASCTAVGGAGDGSMLAERWNGTTWQVQAAAKPAGFQGGGFSGVSCTSSRACTAVGSYFIKTAGPLTLAERWNGTSWRVQSTPNAPSAQRNELFGVSCATATSCTAVGYHSADDFHPPQALTETWQRSGWRILTTPRPAGASSTLLNGVSCPAAGSCAAAGYYFALSGVQLTLAMTSS